MTLQDTSQRADEKHQNEIANKIIETQIKIITAAYDKTMAYTNVIVVAGYAAFFGLWTLTRPYLSKTHALWAALLMCISATIFVMFEVFKMVFTAESLNTQYMTFSKRMEGKKAQEVLDGIQKLEQASGKTSLTFVRAWRISLYIVVATGLVGVGILMFAFLYALFPGTATNAGESIITPKGREYMTLGQQIIGTMIGTTAGFLFSLCLFWIREKWANPQRRNSLEQMSFPKSIIMFDC